MADLMVASGLEKGGIYRHFESKDELALAAFDHAVTLHGARVRSHVERGHTAVARLEALATAVASIVEDPPVPGGCPLLNTAVESDGASGAPYEALRERTRAAMRKLINYTRKIIDAGVASGELRAGVDAEHEASMMVATLEGALMLSMLYADPEYVRRAVGHAAARARSLAAG